MEVCPADISGLVAHGLLDRIRPDNPGDVEYALGALLDRLSR